MSTRNIAKEKRKRMRRVRTERERERKEGILREGREGAKPRYS